MLDNNDSAYIQPFLPTKKALVEAMDEHVRHQHKLSPEKERLEGTIMPYAKNNNDYIRRR